MGQLKLMARLRPPTRMVMLATAMFVWGVRPKAAPTIVMWLAAAAVARGGDDDNGDDGDDGDRNNDVIGMPARGSAIFRYGI